MKRVFFLDMGFSYIQSDSTHEGRFLMKIFLIFFPIADDVPIVEILILVWNLFLSLGFHRVHFIKIFWLIIEAVLIPLFILISRLVILPVTIPTSIGIISSCSILSNSIPLKISVLASVSFVSLISSSILGFESVIVTSIFSVVPF